ncbi:MAG TPA: GNAT family N-acetyltransferase [Candidatus Bathyarchaeia archaeon]|nr:GNAT family N-acetyltransferase [Candidatus Bathyarchaeia archaeon]
MSGAITLAIESPRQAEVARLLEALDAYQSSLYPPESNHFLDVDALAAPTVRFFVARADGEVLGCGALRIDPAGYGELKRMFVLPKARGMGLGRLILDRIEQEARRERLGCVRLETGIHQPEALGLYRAAGYVVRGAFGEYAPDPLSVFMEKTF